MNSHKKRSPIHLAARQMARKEGWIYLCPRPHVRSWMPPLSLPSAITSLPKTSLAQSSASHAEYLICEHTLEVGCLFLVSSAITSLPLLHRVLPLIQIYQSLATCWLQRPSVCHHITASSVKTLSFICPDASHPEYLLSDHMLAWSPN